MKINTYELCTFFAVRSQGFRGELGPREFPAATESFAPVPCRASGGPAVVRYEPDEDWPDNSYRIFLVPEDTEGCIIERESVRRLWKFVGVGGDLWEVVSPEEWRVRNAFLGPCDGLSNSDFGPFTADEVHRLQNEVSRLQNTVRDIRTGLNSHHLHVHDGDELAD